MKTPSDVCYKYKDGRFLKSSYMGDGEYELILTETFTNDCLFPRDWTLFDILLSCNGVYNDNNKFIFEPLYPSDFSVHNTKIKIL